MKWFRGWEMVMYMVLLLSGAYGYVKYDVWLALALFGISIAGIVLCEIRFQFRNLREG